jgi:hypothetical protein
MVRSSLTLLALALVLTVVPAYGITIPERELEDSTGPCLFSVTQDASVRTLTWSPFPGASSYKVGYRIGSSITGLAELSGTSYEHTGWDPQACLEYILVAYDSGGANICWAHVENVGTGCSQ